ncbi:hypothetical protein HTZ97_14200 [Desulfuromonas acetoxidans]|uniref:Uncharacterized protein n=1 Tax=Desulfuromonas acetoxidans (strain DSM 684 / 11070) TaxID=281689 RepID=Q1JWB4_DESA6|nr:hypothetical protein [Desulfuromonas acetoxidans]EAT14507.1 conserved hypothetical protein [Desulfuromonas acetoxidans DSM 684]MBF0645277.1 hypothetical protein [Desulfuromonas acetoxidans]NVD25583.1 hypothetical protein [Desulfuromonas acetoxidans]NVE17607.1 hypothetical protein [Desulfuromonas acetoxidans]
MSQLILNRYEQNDQGAFIIDVAAERVEDLFSNFDKRAPYIRRDLDQAFVDYLIDCAREIGHDPFVIRIELTHPADDSKRQRIVKSISSYFLYLRELEKDLLRHMFRRSAILLNIGLAILFMSVFFNQWLGEERSVVANVFAEGLTVAAWVSLWESLAVFLIEWLPHRKTIALYLYLSSTPVNFPSTHDINPAFLAPNK